MTLPEKTPAVDATIEDRSLLIRESLRNAIIDRRIAPGTKLPEAEVGALFDVSRTVARAALQILAFEGLVKTERNRGAFVSTPSPEEARQIFASRRLIEPGIIAAAVEHITPADIVRFQHHLVEEAQYMNERGPAARRAEIKASGDFHLLLAALSGNVILQRFMDELVARSSLVVALYGRSGISSCGHNEHLAILELVAKGDAKGASDLMIHHLDHIEADLDLQPKQGVSLRNALTPLS
ncbi:MULTISPECIES: GntR family transcriptional regulator [Agrobacterium]|uniref:GntR family transcriptional regulator n=1 Tax=Agrobacterium TaxID=357 RepID=UPI001298058B|nr:MULTISPECIES: GntR family transcriptional regulator [Agrobacterium]MQB12904.1 GntR family transcriptional regulator [Agrobacterium sp. ICMP 6402]NTZ93129.1 GntR family transcriptional regulator [Agrobacterium tumefaciens]